MLKMKITNTKIYDTVKEVVGEDSLKVVEFLKDKKNISDFKIAEKVKTDIHEIRNILYRLYNHNLVTYYRKKDRQKGWYISYWTFNKKRIKDLMKNLHYSKIQRFTERLKHEEVNKGNIYLCPSACVRVNFDKAADFEFKCPECGSILNIQDNEKTIVFLQDKIKELQKTNGFASMSNGNSIVLGNGHKVGDGNKVIKKVNTSRKKMKISRKRR
jgi:transcription initiation factor TFIIE subunit alpha